MRRSHPFNATISIGSEPSAGSLLMCIALLGTVPVALWVAANSGPAAAGFGFATVLTACTIVLSRRTERDSSGHWDVCVPRTDVCLRT